ncbi:MAG: hypothetical protein CM15mP113_2810 [Pseudomonadota bacterium]|nr:MAG: hypothetical protein CM15mP113_2810 [Pseudomonadota bacterium]
MGFVVIPENAREIAPEKNELFPVILFDPTTDSNSYIRPAVEIPA